MNYGYQISSIFIGSPDTGYQLIYLLYLKWSRNASAVKRAENIFAALRKNGRQKQFWAGINRGRNGWFSRQYMEELLILEFLLKHLFYSGLLRASLGITLFPARPRACRIISRSITIPSSARLRDQSGRFD